MYWIKTFHKLLQTKKLLLTIHEVQNHLYSVYDCTNAAYKRHHVKELDFALENEVIDKEQYQRRLKLIDGYDCREERDFWECQILVYIEPSYLQERPIPFLKI